VVVYSCVRINDEETRGGIEETWSINDVRKD